MSIILVMLYRLKAKLFPKAIQYSQAGHNGIHIALLCAVTKDVHSGLPDQTEGEELGTAEAVLCEESS